MAAEYRRDRLSDVPQEVPLRGLSPDGCYGDRLVTLLSGPGVVSSVSSLGSPYFPGRLPCRSLDSIHGL